MNLAGWLRRISEDLKSRALILAGSFQLIAEGHIESDILSYMALDKRNIRNLRKAEYTQSEESGIYAI